MKKYLPILLFLLFSNHLAARTWTSATGKTIEAEFLSGDARNVTIRRSDGKTFVLPLGKLSQADQDFVAEKLKSMPSASGNSIIPNLIIDTSRPWVPVKQNIESAVKSAREKKVEDLVQPVHANRFGGEDNMIWAPNPDGKTWDVLPYYYPSYGAASTVSIVDLGSGEVKVENYPRGTNWHLCKRAIAPNGKVYISVMRGPKVGICIYDPATNEMKVDAIPVPDGMKGETHPLIRSTDGMIFAGGGFTGQTSTCIMINPENDAVTDFGACGPSHAPTNAYNYFMGADDTHVYIASGKVPWFLVAVNRQTKEKTVLATTKTNGGLISVYQQVHGVVANVRIGDGSARQDYWCYQGKLVPKKEKCPWPETGLDLEKSFPPKPEVYTERILPQAKGIKAELWVKASVPGVKTDPKFPGWSPFLYDVPLFAMGSLRLSELPDGRIYGTAGAYTGQYIYDPASGESRYLGAISLSHYASVQHENKIWMSGYPASQLFAYDFNKPWTAVTGAGPGTQLAPVESPESNPQLVTRFGKSGCHKMYNGTVGASGHLYFGGRWMRTGNGGGLGWWDTKTGKEDGISEPFSAQAITHLCTAGDGKYIVISTKKVIDTVLKKPTPNEGTLIIFDDAKKEIISEITVESGIAGPGPIVWAGGNRVLGWTQDPSDSQKSILYGVDVEKSEVVWKQPIPYGLPMEIGGNQTEEFDFRLGPDGQIWTFMGEKGTTLVKIDPQNAKVDPVAEAGRGGRLAFSGADVYLSGTTYLRRIKDVVER